MWIDRACRRVLSRTIGRSFSFQAASPIEGSTKVDRMLGSLTSCRSWSSGAVVEVDDHHSSGTRYVEAGGWRISSGRAFGRKGEMEKRKHEFYSTAAACSNLSGSPIQLESERFEPPFNPLFPLPRSPIIILHGLFGSKQNWRSLAKRLSHATHRVVYTLVCLPFSPLLIQFWNVSLQKSQFHG